MYINTKNFRKHIAISFLAYFLFATSDVYFTLSGIQGDISLEGNPVIRYFMEVFGITAGLITGKLIVFTVALLIAIVAYGGIDKDANWIYYLTLTRMAKNWMRRKKRYWVAFAPIYVAAFAQGIAALSWVYLIFIASPV